MANSWTFGAHLPEDSTLAPLSASDLAKIGQHFGAYRISETLGEGAHGVVYSAQGPAGREVALKVLKSRLDDSRRERFRREGEVAASLAHEGIVHVLGGGEFEGQPFLVYELVEGARELDQYLKDLPLDERVRTLLRVAEALGYAHARGIVHRDLKASNVLVDSAGRPRVADFGLAKAKDGQDLTQTGAILGTPKTMAPEQIVSDLELVGPPTDVWALGVMLYEAICARLPFDAITFVELQARVVASDPERPTEIVQGLSPELEAVCLKALAKDPANRYVDGAALAADLARYLAGEPTHAKAALGEAGARSSLRWAVGVAVAAVLLLGLGLGVWANQDPKPIAAPTHVGPPPERAVLDPAPGSLPETSDPLLDPSRFPALVRAELVTPPINLSEANRLEVWRVVFTDGSWLELGRKLDPEQRTRLDFLAADAARNPKQYRRWAVACYLSAWEQGDPEGMHEVGSWLLDSNRPERVFRGQELIRRAASRPSLFEGGSLRRASPREVVARLSARRGAADLAQLRELGERFPPIKERLKQVEQDGSPSALYRLGQQLSSKNQGELSFRVYLRAAVSGKKAARRALRWHGSTTAAVGEAWLRLAQEPLPSDDDKAWRVVADWLLSEHP